MSAQQQTKRAARAKERARQRARDKHRERSSGFFTGFPSGDSPIGNDQSSWFERPVRRGPRELLEGARAGELISLLIDEARALDATRLYREAETVLIAWVRHLYESGWQPTELIRFVAMRGKTAGLALLREAMTAERDSRQGHTKSDERWVRQWAAADLPATVTARWVLTWAEPMPAGEALRQLLRLATLLGTAPAIELLLPSPSASEKGAGAARPAAAAADPILGRVRALLAKAESTDHESEAMALTAKAQELMTKHAIDLAMLEGAGQGADTPHLIRVPVDAPYLQSKAFLLKTVAENTRCRALLHTDLAMSSVIGYPADLDAVELLFTSLLVQAQRALMTASAAAPPGARSRSQAFRAAFLHGFTERIDERLIAVNRVAYADAKAATFLPVLRSHDVKIDQFIAERFRATVTERVRGGFDSAGYVSGQRAADAAALTGAPLPAGDSRVNGARPAAQQGLF